jgi:hypothetical protein
VEQRYRSELRKEDFSKAYVRAVAAAAGFCVTQPERDLDSGDLQIYSPGIEGTVRSPYLGVQLKCTAIQPPSDASMSYPLEADDYGDLINPQSHIKLILVVMIVPEKIEQWLSHTAQSQSMFRRAFWKSLYGRPATSNSRTVSVMLDQRFTVDALQNIMLRVGKGDLP